jgi:predicted N-acetyltransferase YhbS
MKARLREAATDNEVPLSLIALVGDEPVGTVNFIESDNAEFPGLKPWLAALLVTPKFRQQGVGAALVKECIRYAEKIGIQTFYLGTDIPEFYESLGAKLYTVDSKNLQIMKVDTSIPK